MWNRIANCYFRHLRPTSSFKCSSTARCYSTHEDSKYEKRTFQNEYREQPRRKGHEYTKQRDMNYKRNDNRHDRHDRYNDRHDNRHDNRHNRYPNTRTNTRTNTRSHPKSQNIPPNVPVVYFSHGKSTSIKVPIEINPRNVRSFEDLQLNQSVLTSLYESNPSIKSPTEIQKKILSLLKSDVSVMVRSDSGSGKSLATILYMMSYARPTFGSKDMAYISNLILVPSPQLAAQYYKQFEQIVKSMPGDNNIHNVVQTLFRGDPATDEAQMNLLKQFPGPHTLISTPNRLLDYLSSEKRDLVPLFNLSCVALDEMDALYWKELVKSSSTTIDKEDNKRAKKRKPKQIPVDLLMNHIKSWRDGYLRNAVTKSSLKKKNVNDIAFVPLRIIMNASVDFPGFDKMIETKPWLKDNQRPVLTIGVNDSSRGVVYNMRSDVDSYFVNYDRGTKDIGDLMQCEGLEQPEPITTIDSSAVSNYYSDCLMKLIKHNESKRKAEGGAETSPSLIILPDGIPCNNLAKLLESNGYTCGLADFSSSTGFSSIDNTSIDPTNKSTTNMVISQATNIHGISFSNLSTIYVLDWHLIYPRILYTKLAGLLSGSNSPSIYLINTTINDTSLEIFKSSISSIEGLTIKSIK